MQAIVPEDLISRQPLAIVGIGCRFPGGANNPQQFWRLLREGVDTVAQMPTDRWDGAVWHHPDPAIPGRTYTLAAACIEGFQQFDADFFGIAPREAAQIEPQHRMLLEVCWEALEDAGIPPLRLRGSDAGVFVGMHPGGDLERIYNNPESIDAYTNIGKSGSLGANRLSHFFDLHGPSIMVDTACSSSLVALHLACESLWRGETSLALVGGANFLVEPTASIGFCKASMLSRRGRCFTFDARADGYVRGEGAGILVLKPLARAVADQDRVYAVVRGAGVNQDGHTPGIAQPGQASQAALLRSVLERAEVHPARVQYVEAHGTGTPVGDPIECAALGEVLAPGRSPESACRIGSVKTNIGHLETASGVAGVIKLALMLQARTLAPSLHFEQPNPQIDFDGLRLRVQTRCEPWPATAGPRIGCVNSFGYGGTNALAVLEEFVPSAAHAIGVPADVQRPEALIVSARAPAALRALAESYYGVLTETTPSRLGDLCFSAAVRRQTLEHRLAVVGRSAAEIAGQLRTFIDEGRAPGVSTGRQSSSSPRRIAFVFCGNGPQWWGMGRQLLDSEPVFRAALEHADAAFRPLASWSLLEELTVPEQRSHMDRTSIAQPALFAVQYGLAELWRSWGIEPEATLGHSIGELAAALTAGAMTLEEAARVVFHRSRTQERTRGQGRMAALSLSAEEATAVLAPHAARLGIAAINSPTSVTISGDPALLRDVMAKLQERQVFCRELRLDYAFHSPVMEAIRDEFLQALAGLAPRGKSTCRFVSTVTANDASAADLVPSYWWASVRQPVRFAAALNRLIESGIDTFVEIGPHPVLAGYVSESLAAANRHALIVGSLRRQADERETLLTSLGMLHAAGADVCWPGVFPTGQFVALPTYPWQRERHWPASTPRRLGLGAHPVHPLLGGRVEMAQPCWEAEIDVRLQAYLADHRIAGAVLFPMAGYLELGLAVGRQILGPGPCEVEDLEVASPLPLPEDRSVLLQTIATPEDRTFRIASWSRAKDQSWKTYVNGKFNRPASPSALPKIDVDGLLSRFPKSTPAEVHYRTFCLEFGPCLKGIEWMRVGAGESLAKAHLPPALSAERNAYHFHPASLDCCIQSCSVVVHSTAGTTPPESLVLPTGVERFCFHGVSPGTVLIHAVLRKRVGRDFLLDATVFDESGRIMATLHGLRERLTEAGQVSTDESLLYRLNWEYRPLKRLETPLRDAGFLTPPGQLIAAMRPDAVRLGRERERHYRDYRPRLDRLSLGYVWQALGPIVRTVSNRSPITAERLIEEGGLQADFLPYLDPLLNALAAHGILQRNGDGWVVAPAAPNRLPEPGCYFAQLIKEAPAYLAELLLIERCGRHLSGIIKGAVQPLETIFPQGSMAVAEQYYDSSPSRWAYNALLQKALGRLLADMPKGRVLHILEVGAGTGGTTGWLLRALPADQTRYTFTDVSDVFLARARERFRQHSFVDYRLLDIERDPGAQGFPAHGFDVVICSNVLHGTSDLHKALGNVRQLLASEGTLAMIELSDPPPLWVQLVFGLLPGWRRFADSGRRTSGPLLTESAWHDVLNATGFTDIGVLSDHPEAEAPEQCVYLARVPRFDTRAHEMDLDGDIPVIPVSNLIMGPGQDPLAQPLRTRTARTWLILGDLDGKGAALAARLSAEGRHVAIAQKGNRFLESAGGTYVLDAGAPADWDRVLRRVLANGPSALGIVHLWGLDVRLGDTAAATELCTDVLLMVQALERAGAPVDRRLWLVTAGAEGFTGEAESDAGLFQAPLWGLGRVIRNEQSEGRCVLVDIGPPAAVASEEEPLDALFDELHADDDEPEVLLCGPDRFVRRLRNAPAEEPIPGVDMATDSSFHLEVPRRKGLDQIRCRQTPRVSPGPGQIEIEVSAAGLNFRDVLLALDLIPADLYESSPGGAQLGLECAGVVRSIGEGVRRWRPGDAVVASAPNAFSRFVVAATDRARRLPHGWTFAEAATVPSVFLTAWYSLRHLAQLAPGERVLIHGAAGGIGLAAIQIAHHLGGEIFATAGTLEKRDFLRAAGVAHVFDSRSLAFVEEVRAATAGQGVDVVLNSTTGETMERSLALLRPFGRFLEIGKRDFLENRALGLRPFLKNLSYFSVDVDQVGVRRPALVQEMLDELMALFAQGVLSPLPHRTFAVSDAAAAFQHMQRSQHIGKVVLSLDDAAVSVLPPQTERLSFRPDATYLITGGLGGFGSACARWIVENGARHVVLVGRRGEESPAARQTRAALESAGGRVRIAAVDITNAAALERLLADIRAEWPPLRGVFHSAMVLEDGSIFNLDRQRIEKVLAPKMVGAWNLHQLTLNDPLEHFVLFSSVASMLGSPGQANYAAGNAFLDRLAVDRRRWGLPALAVNWGVIGEVGHVAEREDLEQRLARRGSTGLAPRRALRILGQLMQSRMSGVGVMDIDWQQMARARPQMRSKVWSHLLATEPAEAGASPERKDFPQLLNASPREQWPDLVRARVAEHISGVIGMSPERVDSGKSLTSMGLDSLMAVELSIRLERDLQTYAPVMTLMRGPSISELASQLTAQLLQQPEAPAENGPARTLKTGSGHSDG